MQGGNLALYGVVWLAVRLLETVVFDVDAPSQWMFWQPGLMV